jgi:LysM repeat protein
MKRFFLICLLTFTLVPLVRAQDAATQEQLDRLRSEVSSLQTANVDLQKRLSDVLKELQELKTQIAKPTGNYAGADDVKQLAEAIKEVDRKRAADRELILGEIKKASKVAAAAPVVDRSAPAEKGYEYTVQSGDTLSAIVQAYRDQGVKVTVDDVLKANPNLKPSSMRVGQKIFVPNSK